MIYELTEGVEVPDDAIDGMEELLGDDTLDTDYDLDDGDIPPPGFWSGTHDRYGNRIPGFTEEEYTENESWR